MTLRVLQLAVWDYSIHMHLMPLVRACRERGYQVSCAGAPGPFVREIEAELLEKRVELDRRFVSSRGFGAVKERT